MFDDLIVQDRPRQDPKDLRIAWLAPSLARGWRWQAMWREFCAIHPNTVILTARWPGCTTGYEGIFNIKIVPGFRRIRFRGKGGKRGSGFMWASPRVVIDLLRFHPEIILTNGFHVWTIWALAVKALCNTRLVLLWQGVSPETGGEVGSLRLKFRRWASRFFDLAITNTTGGASYLKTVVGFPSPKVRKFVGEVACKDSFRKHLKQPLQVPQRKPIFLFVGRLIPGKGVGQLLRACALLARAGERDYSVLIVGQGSQNENLCELARKLEIEDLVQFEGFISYDLMRPYYECCDVFVLPSLEDTWGVAVVEAMAFGKAVLCSRRAGVSELVAHGVNGFLFDPENPGELAALLTQFIGHPGRVSRFGRNSEILMTQHSPARVAGLLSQMLCSTLGVSIGDKQFNKERSLSAIVQRPFTDVHSHFHPNSRPSHR